MSEIYKAIDETLRIDGIIRLRPFDEKILSKLNDRVLWDCLRSSGRHVTLFGNDTWYSDGNNLTICFVGLTRKYSYQLKSLVLGLYTQGAGEGMEPLSWGTIRHIVTTMKRFLKGLQKEGIHSLDEVAGLPDLKVRNLLQRIVPSKTLRNHPSYAEALLSSAYWMKVYGIVEKPSFFKILQDYLKPFACLKKERQKRHVIVPVRILKLALGRCENEIELARKVFDDWEALQQRINNSISNANPRDLDRSTYLKALSKSEKSKLTVYHQHIQQLKSCVFTLVLAYTGMRLGEAMALSDDSAIAKDGKFYLRTRLSKTTDGTQELEWVTNEITYQGVTLLSKICQVYRQRAELILDYHGEQLPEARRFNLLYGVSEKALFNATFHKKSCRFAMHTKSSRKNFTDINGVFDIAVTEADIKQLDRMGCNYQSVGSSHKQFKKPYKVGDKFNFTAHQFRHTFAWFVVANRLGDLDDIKYQFKHLDNCMTLVYSQRGYESMEDLIHLTESFSEFMVKEAVDEMVQSAEQGRLAGKGGQNFIERLETILNDDITTGKVPHFNNMQELLTFTAKFTSNFRGLSHGYCTKGSDCKVKNAADPSHCVYCDSYIATPKHLQHWLVIQQKCESQLQAFDAFPEHMQKRFESFSTALRDNLEAANSIIQQLTTDVRKA